MPSSVPGLSFERRRCLNGGLKIWGISYVDKEARSREFEKAWKFSSRLDSDQPESGSGTGNVPEVAGL